MRALTKKAHRQRAKAHASQTERHLAPGLISSLAMLMCVALPLAESHRYLPTLTGIGGGDGRVQCIDLPAFTAKGSGERPDRAQRLHSRHATRRQAQDAREWHREATVDQ